VWCKGAGKLHRRLLQEGLFRVITKEFVTTGKDRVGGGGRPFATPRYSLPVGREAAEGGKVICGRGPGDCRSPVKRGI